MDVIQLCLSLVPVPYLGLAFSGLRFIWSSIQQVQASKQQLKALAQSIAQLLQTLNEEYSAKRLLHDKTSTPLEDLNKFVLFILLLCLLMYNFTAMQPTRHNLHFCSEGSIPWISTAAVYPRTENLPN
jgi:hypothetical protein